MRVIYIYFIVFILSTGCQKFLDVKSDSQKAIPSTIQDFQILLDNFSIINNSSSYAQEALADNYYLLQADLNSVSNITDRGMYTWEVNDQTDFHWAGGYKVILHANVSIEGLESIEPKQAERENWEVARGTAYFHRGFALESLLQLFSLPYDSSSAERTPGVPIRLRPDFNQPTIISSVADGYKQVLKDLRIASDLLPISVPYKTRPNKAAAFGLLARVFLTMQKFDSAFHYAEKSLSLYDSLINYNQLSPTSAAPFVQQNREVVFLARSTGSAIISPVRAKIDSNLINSYSIDDLRFSLYFRRNPDGSYGFKGDYDGRGATTGYHFSGIVTDEQYLIASESAARIGEIEKSLKWTNKLLITRFKTGSFNPYSINDPQALIKIVLDERRKSLLFRGARWRDLRRLSIEPQYTIRPKRIINGNEKILEPGSTGYRLQIPFSVKQINGFPENP